MVARFLVLRVVVMCLCSVVRKVLWLGSVLTRGVMLEWRMSVSPMGLLRLIRLSNSVATLGSE